MKKILKTLTNVTIQDILTLNKNEYIMVEDSEGFTISIDRAEIFHNTEYVIMTDFEGQTKLYDIAFIKVYPSEFIQEVNEDFNNIMI